MLSDKVVRRRLMVLIRHMEKLPPQARKHFDMRGFLIHEKRDCHDHPAPQTTRQLLHACGTTACAMGFAATMPYFRKLGLRFDSRGRLSTMAVIANPCTPLWGELFGGGEHDKTPKAWARRARSVLANPIWWGR